MLLRLLALSTSLAISVLTTQVHADEASIFVEIAEEAISKGHGEECSLSMKPVRSGGYYPCVDIGPYRFVQEYGKATVFMVEEDREPFPIFVRTQEGSHFLHDGPWLQDMDARATLWWSNKRSNIRTGAYEPGRLDAAAAYINKLRQRSRPAEAPAATAKAAAPVAEPSVELIGPDAMRILQSQ